MALEPVLAPLVAVRLILDPIRPPVPIRSPWMVLFALLVSSYIIYSEDLQDVLQTNEYFRVVIILVDKERIGAGYNVPVQPVEERDLIGQ
jgi:hypothetical protein